MDELKRKVYIDRLTDNLPMLRVKLRMTQKEFANIIGVSSFTVLAIEKRQRNMTWNTFLSMMLIFVAHEDTRQLLKVLDIYTDELINFIEGRQSYERAKN